MSSVNLYDDHINTYNMIKHTLFKIFIQLKISQIFYQSKNKIINMV